MKRFFKRIISSYINYIKTIILIYIFTYIIIEIVEYYKIYKNRIIYNIYEKKILNIEKYDSIIIKNNYNESCSICMENFQNKDLIIELKCGCQIIYHKKCIKEWLLNNDKCPICHYELSKMIKNYIY